MKFKDLPQEYCIKTIIDPKYPDDVFQCGRKKPSDNDYCWQHRCTECNNPCVFLDNRMCERCIGNTPYPRMCSNCNDQFYSSMIDNAESMRKEDSN